MILILGGTTEGRLAAAKLDEAAKPYFYSTYSDSQHIDSAIIRIVSGGMDVSSMVSFCRENDIALIVDAAHPFASRLHATVAETASRLGLPVVRYERQYPPRNEDIIWCENFNDAITKLNSSGITRLLALTGVQTITTLSNWWMREENECWFRILDRNSSRDKADRAGFPEDRLLYYDESGESTATDIEKIRPQAIITKESGISGGFPEKVEAARSLGVKIFAIQRPQMPDGFITVTGQHGFRRAIERLLPGYYPLRTGFTTGSCATAASMAALSALLDGNDDISEISFPLPDGEIMSMPIEDIELLSPTSAIATVIKDAGDDPDITDGCSISAKVEIDNEKPAIRFHGGNGVGTVTLPGLGLAIGEPAINPTPREMMRKSLSALYPDGGIDVTISVKGGKELAAKTFNPRLGIVGGISIIGTSGIVSPYSHEAFTASIRRQMEIAMAIGVNHLILNSGAKSQRYVSGMFPGLPLQAFIHYGNAVGEAVSMAAELRVERITVGLMLGKAVKLAQGELDTHSRQATFSHQFLIETAREAGCSQKCINRISGITLVRELWTLLPTEDLRLLTRSLLSYCRSRLLPLAKDSILNVVLVSESGDIYGIT